MNAAREFISDMAEHISLPTVYLELRELIENSEAGIDDYVGVIEKDSMLSVRIIRISKSEFFGFPRQTDDLYQAISLIGVMQLHDILLSCLCMRAFSSIPSQIINLKDFWQYSIHCGIAARIIAQHCLFIASDKFFTLGLMHEIGHAAMFVKAPEISVQVLENHRAQNGSITELERELLGFDYSQLGAELMQLWHLPEVYQQVAANHLQPQHADEAYSLPVQIIHLAHAICQNPVVGQQRDLIDSSVENTKQLKHLPDNIDDIVLTEIDSHTDSILSMLWPCGAQDLLSDNRWHAHG